MRAPQAREGFVELVLAAARGGRVGGCEGSLGGSSGGCEGSFGGSDGGGRGFLALLLAAPRGPPRGPPEQLAVREPSLEIALGDFFQRHA